MEAAEEWRPIIPLHMRVPAEARGGQSGGLERGGGGGWACGGGGGWHKAWVSDCLPLAAPIGLSPLHIPTLCGSERVLVVSTEPPDDLSCLTAPGVGCPGDGAVAWGGGGDMVADSSASRNEDGNF